MAAVLDPAQPSPPEEAARWLVQARRKLDPGFRRRLGDLAAPAIWRQLSLLSGATALDGDTGMVIDALAELEPAVFANLAEDAERFQSTVVDVLRRFDRLAFAAFWRMAEPGFLAAAQEMRMDHEDRESSDEMIYFPSVFAPSGHRIDFKSPKGRKTAVRFVTSQESSRPVERLLSATPVHAIADPALVFHALGDATRYAIAGMLAREALTSAELARRLGVSGPTLAHHLRALRRARLVLETRRGNSILLRLDRAAIAALSAIALEQLFGSQPVTIRRSRSAARASANLS